MAKTTTVPAPDPEFSEETSPALHKKRRKGVVSTSVYDPARVQAMRLTDADKLPAHWNTGITIGECFDLYMSEHKHRKPEWNYNITEALTQFLSVQRMHENLPVSTISKDRCRTYKTMLLNGRAQSPSKRKPGPITIARKLGIIRHFTKWLCANDFLDRDVMEGVGLPPKLVSNARVRKEAFTDDQLGLILTRLSPYRTDPDPMRVEWHWLTLLLMHSGCRAMEVTQLHKGDVSQVDGIWCMSLKDDATKKQRLKNRVSQRIVPIHSAVLKAGLLEWITAQPAGQLFPKLKVYGVQKSSGWFAHLLKGLGIKTPSLTQHSMRHTMTVKLERARVHYSLMRRLLGHAVGHSVEDRVYLGSLSYSAKELSEALESVVFPPIP